MAAFQWPDTAKAQIRTWFLTDGLSATQIAAKLSNEYKASVSRNAVIGKLSRMGVTAEQRAKGPAAPRVAGVSRSVKLAPSTVPKAPRVQKPRPPAPVVEPVAAVLARQPSTAPKPPPPPELVVVGQAVVLAGLKACQCKYPVGPEPKIGDMDQQLFCAAPTGDATLVYCPDHAAIAWKPSTAAEKAKRLKNDIGAAHRDMLARNSRRHTSGTRAVF